VPPDLLCKPCVRLALPAKPIMKRHSGNVPVRHLDVNGSLDNDVPLAHIRDLSMEAQMAQMTTQEFAEECRARRVDYDNLFKPRVTPEWLLKFEQQVLDECRVDLSYLSDPNWQRIFEMRVQVMNAERERERE
jgi:hypothetical protein